MAVLVSLVEESSAVGLAANTHLWQLLVWSQRLSWATYCTIGIAVLIKHIFFNLQLKAYHFVHPEWEGGGVGKLFLCCS